MDFPSDEVPSNIESKMASLRGKMLDGLSEDTRDFWVDSRVPVLHKPTSARFLREAVCRYHPVLITGLIDDWPALQKWDKDYLIGATGDRKLNINLTTDGHGDCVKDVCRVSLDKPLDSPQVLPHFVYPAEHDMTMKEFYELLESSKISSTNCDTGKQPIPYLSQQNDNLRQNMPELLKDIQTTLPLATEAFGSEASTTAYSLDGDEHSIVSGALEAVNLWIGDERSVSSLHKDHYENMYAVVSGQKTFTLLPPTDAAFLAPYTKVYTSLRYAVRGANNVDANETSTPEQPQYQYFDNAQDAASYYTNQTNSSDLTTHNSTPQLELTNQGCPSETLEWISLDPEDSEVSTKYPLFHTHATPLRVTVLPGQVLYIPAMWYHRVSQKCLTVSVNYWFDQKFDFRYVHK